MALPNFDERSVPIMSKGRVTVQIKGTNPGGVTLADYTDVGCLVGDVTLGRQWADDSVEHDNWCIHQNAATTIERYNPGAKTITSSITLEAILAEDAYQFLHENNGSEFDIKFTLEDAETNKTTQTLEYRIVKTSDSLNMRGGAGQTTQFTFDFQVNEIIDEDIETAA